MSYRVRVETVKPTELRVHELQEKYSPWMNEVKWRQWFEQFAKDGQQYPVDALPDGRVFNGKHRLKAALELGLAEIQVAFHEGLTEKEVIERIVADKTQKDELTVGQRVAIEINRAEAEGLFERGKQAQIEAGKYGKLGGRGNKHKTPVRTRAQGFQKTRDIIAERAGVHSSTVQKLLTIKIKRPDLFQRVFNGWYDEKGREVTINAVYRMMKLEEKGGDDKKKANGSTVQQTKQVIKETIERVKTSTEQLPDKKEEESNISPDNRLLYHLKHSVYPFVISLAESFESLLLAKDEEIKKEFLQQMEWIADSVNRILLVSDKNKLLKILEGIYHDAEQ